MSKFVNHLKFKIKCLKLNEYDYLTMKRQSECYEKMMSAIGMEIEINKKDTTDRNGNLLRCETISENVVINIDTKEMLRKIGLEFKENAIWNVK